MIRFLSGFQRATRIYATLLFVVPATLLVAAPQALTQPAGYWHTSGSQILDSAAKTVRIGGVNWYGFETTNEVVHGLTSQDYKTILATIRSLGYNTVRLPYSNQMIESPIVPGNIAYANSAGAINTDLKGLNALQIMDRIVAQAGQLGLKVILDNHRSEAGNSAEANGLWYTTAYPEKNWIADWQTLVTRYASYTDASGNPTLIGVDLRNEPHNATSGGSCWTGDTSVGGCPASNTAQNWPAAAARAANAVLASNSKLLIFVEGTDCYSGDCDFWGGNLEGAGSYPVQLNVAQRLVYSAHDYGPTEYRQSWFNANTTPQRLQAVWTKYWAYLSINGIAPVWVGEFGTTNDAASAESSTPGSEGQWFSSLVNFLANQPAIHWTYWALNGEDNYGLLDANYDATPPSSLKQQLLSSIQANSETKQPSCSAIPPVPGGLAALASSSSTIGLAWTAVAAPANCSVTYSVFRGTASGFALTSATQIAGNLHTPTYPDTKLAASTTYYYAVVAIDAYGHSASSAKASATTSKASNGTATCQVTYSVLSQWATGFQASIAIKNTGTTDISSWTLKFTFPGNQQITSAWNANSSESGEAVTLTSEAYNGGIAAGATYSSIGFTGTYSGTNTSPPSFSVNGNVCQ